MLYLLLFFALLPIGCMVFFEVSTVVAFGLVSVFFVLEVLHSILMKKDVKRSKYYVLVPLFCYVMVFLYMPGWGRDFEYLFNVENTDNVALFIYAAATVSFVFELICVYKVGWKMKK